jgi:hypothetical protein
MCALQSLKMTDPLHHVPGAYTEFDMKRQLAELDYVTSSQAAAISHAKYCADPPID